MLYALTDALLDEQSLMLRVFFCVKLVLILIKISQESVVLSLSTCRSKEGDRNTRLCEVPIEVSTCFISYTKPVSQNSSNTSEVDETFAINNK